MEYVMQCNSCFSRHILEDEDLKELRRGSLTCDSCNSDYTEVSLRNP